MDIYIFFCVWLYFCMLVNGSIEEKLDGLIESAVFGGLGGLGLGCSCLVITNAAWHLTPLFFLYSLFIHFLVVSLQLISPSSVYGSLGWNTFSLTRLPSFLVLFTGAPTRVQVGVFVFETALNNVNGFSACTSSINPGASPCMSEPTALRFLLTVSPNEFPVGTVFI